MSVPIRVLWISDSPHFETGFGRVTKELTHRLAQNPNLQLSCIGWGYDGSAAMPQHYRVPVYPASASACGQDVIESVVADFKPDVVVSLGELRMVEWLARHEVRHQFKWVGYVPLDGGPFYPPWESILRQMSEVIAMSRFGQETLQSGLKEQRVRMIYHGVDDSVYRPLPDRRELKKHPRFRDKFVVGCVARNQPRKNLPALVQAFALLSKRYSDLHLYLHSMPSQSGYDLPSLLKRYQLQGRADLASPDLKLQSGLTDEQMNELYNLFDVMALPTCAEGFGLPLIESMAAGVPVVATNFSACPELVRGRGELAAVKTTIISGGNILEQAIVDVEDLARCIEKLYLSPALREEYGRAGRAFAESLSWDSLIPQWLEVLSAASGVDLLASEPIHNSR